MNIAAGCGSRDPNGEDAVDPKKLQKRETQSKSRAKIKNEGQRRKERLVEMEHIAANLRGQNRALCGELDKWRQSEGYREVDVNQLRLQLTTAHQITAQQQQTIVQQQRIIWKLQQQQRLTQQMELPNQRMINDDLARGHTVTGADFQAQHDPTILEALQSPSMNDLYNIDTGELNLDDFSHGFFNLDDVIHQDYPQTYLLDSPQDHGEECVKAKLLGHGNKSLGKKRATSSDDPVLPVDQSQFAKLPKLSHTSGFVNSYVGESSKSLASDFSDPFSIANCMRELNKVEGLDSAQYQKAMINFGDRDYRVKFILMREDFRKDWLSSNEAI